MNVPRLGPTPRFASIAWSIALALATLSATARPARTADGIWSELEPPCRVSHSAIYDPVRDRVLVFGGTDGLRRNDVWALTLSGTPQWTRLRPAGTPPSPRVSHSAIYDPVADRMLVFGGDDGVPRGDVWQLTLSGFPRWTQLAPGGSAPEARSGHSAIYDPVRHRMVVVAGLGAGGVLNDVWVLSLGGTPAWSPLSSLGTPPSARTRQAAIYDPPRDRLVLVGGDLGQLQQVIDETWALSLGASPAWTLITPSGSGPEPRSRASAIYDPHSDSMILQGGSMASSFFTFYDAWQLNLSTGQWDWLGTNHPLRHAAGVVYDPVRSRMILVGGSHHSTVFLSSTLVLPLAPMSTWTLLIGGGPGAVASHSAVFDPVRERLVTFGGHAMGAIDPSPRNDTWAYHPGEGTWEFVSLDGPSARLGHTAVFDAARDRMLVFGGDEIYGPAPVHNDTWVLDFTDLFPSPAWSQLLPAGPPPPPRSDHTAVMDPVGDRMVIFGGGEGSLTGPPVYHNDVWALGLSPSPAWTQIVPTGTPPAPRFGHTAVYDPAGQRIVVFGGQAEAGRRNDVWILTLAGPPAWSEQTPAGTPPSGRVGHVAVYDPVGHRMLVFGGFTALGTVDEVWALSLGGSPAWTQLLPYGPSPGRPGDHAAAWDPVHQRMLTCGGFGGSGMWSFQPPGAASAEPFPTVAGLALAGVRPNPVVGDLVVAFTLPDDGPARLELFDTAGRRVASRDVGSLGAGAQRVTLGPAGRLPAGIYLVRLTHATWSLAVRAAVVR